MPSAGCWIEPSPYPGETHVESGLQLARGRHEDVVDVLARTGRVTVGGGSLAFWGDLVHVLVPVDEEVPAGV